MTALPQERYDRLAKLWNDGVSGKDIAEEFGTTTNNIGAMRSVLRRRGVELQVRWKRSKNPAKLQPPPPVLIMLPCLGYCGKKWLTTMEIRVCPACAKMQRSVA